MKIKEKRKKKSPNIYDFVGILSEDEASGMKEAIAGTCKTKDDFIEYLLNGPVYSDKDIRIIEENRKSIAAWRIAN